MEIYQVQSLLNKKKYVGIFTLLFIVLTPEKSITKPLKIYPYKQIEYKYLVNKPYIKDYGPKESQSVFFYKNNHTVLLSTDWNMLLFYDIETGSKYNKKIKINGYNFKKPKLSPDSKYLILDCIKESADSDENMIVLYNLEKNTYITLFKGRNYVLSDSNFSNDSKYFLLRVEDNIHIYNVETKKREYLYKDVFDYYSEPSYISCCTENNKSFLTMGKSIKTDKLEKSKVTIRDLKTGKLLEKTIRSDITNYESGMRPKLSKNGKYILGVNNLHDSKTMKKIFNLQKKNFYYGVFSNDSNYFTCGVDSDKNLIIYSIKDKTETAILTSLKNKKDFPDKYYSLINVEYSNDDKFILSMADKYITIWKIKQ